MFGIGFFEILIILIVAVIFLGPNKLPQAVVDVVKFFRAVKKTINEAKDTLDKEINISNLKQEALEYKHNFESNVEQITKDIQFKEIDEMFDEYKQLPRSIAQQARNPSESNPKQTTNTSDLESSSISPKLALKVAKNTRTTSILTSPKTKTKSAASNKSASKVSNTAIKSRTSKKSVTSVKASSKPTAKKSSGKK